MAINRAAGAVSFVEYVATAGYETEIVQKPESSQGFVPEKNRWPVEPVRRCGSFGCGSPPGLNFRRRLFRGVEKTVESSETMLRIAFISFLINRLAE